MEMATLRARVAVGRGPRGCGRRRIGASARKTYNDRFEIFWGIFGPALGYFLDIFEGYLGEKLWISWPTPNAPTHVESLRLQIHRLHGKFGGEELA